MKNQTSTCVRYHFILLNLRMDMDELYYQAIDLLKELIAIPSFSREEGAAADVIERRLTRDDLTVSRHGNNVWVVAPGYDPALRTILLNSHIDTVKPVAGWTRDPFMPEEDEHGRLFGLGSNDAGASLVSLIVAFIYMSEQTRSYNLIMLASAEEEVSGKNGIESVINLLPKIDVAIVGEPTGMNPAIAEKGLMVLDAEVKGVAGHAARDEGDNAIYRAVDTIRTLKELQLPKVSEMLGPVKISVTQINAGTQHNVVPDSCKMVVDVRTTDAYTNAETLDMIRQAVPECICTPRSTRLNPSGISPEHPIVRRLEILGYMPFGSPTLSDQALMPWQSVKVGPGQSSRSHTADEYVMTEEIRTAIAIYIRVLNGLTI